VRRFPISIEARRSFWFGADDNVLRIHISVIESAVNGTKIPLKASE
jgi:hypothetical protein